MSAQVQEVVVGYRLRAWTGQSASLSCAPQCLTCLILSCATCGFDFSPVSCSPLLSSSLCCSGIFKVGKGEGGTGGTSCPFHFSGAVCSSRLSMSFVTADIQRFFHGITWGILWRPLDLRNRQFPDVCYAFSS